MSGLNKWMNAYRTLFGLTRKHRGWFFLGQSEPLACALLPSQCIPRARLLHIVQWFYVKSDLSNSAAVAPQLGFSGGGQAPLHLAQRFWNLISGRRVKGWRPRPDPAEKGACVKSFTPWAGKEGGRGVTWEFSRGLVMVGGLTANWHADPL